MMTTSYNEISRLNLIQYIDVLTYYQLCSVCIYMIYILLIFLLIYFCIQIK